MKEKHEHKWTKRQRRYSKRKYETCKCGVHRKPVED